MDLRKEIFWGDEMGDDKPVEPAFVIPYTVSPDDWGMAPVYHRTDSQGSCVWDAPIRDYRHRSEEAARAAVRHRLGNDQQFARAGPRRFGKILSVELRGIWWWSLGVTLPAAALRGLQNILCDFVDHPDELKELLAILSAGLMEKLDYLEANNLLTLNNDGTYVGSGGFGFTDELPQRDFAGRVRCADLWGFTESQETVGVSPAMYREFIFPCEKPLMDRFGLNCYGCCEPLHHRWPVVKQHPRLRRVSCSPWADLAKMAENLDGKYVLSLKPNPAAIASPVIDEQAVRQSLRKAVQLTQGCNVEIIMKDNHTIGNRPENVVRWCRIAKEEINA